MKAEEILSYLNRLEQEESTFRAVKREIGSVIPAYLEAQKGLAELEKRKQGWKRRSSRWPPSATACKIPFARPAKNLLRSIFSARPSAWNLRVSAPRWMATSPRRRRSW